MFNLRPFSRGEGGGERRGEGRGGGVIISSFDVTDLNRELWIWSHLLEKSLMQNFIFCAVHEIALNTSVLQNALVSSLVTRFICPQDYTKKGKCIVLTYLF